MIEIRIAASSDAELIAGIGAQSFHETFHSVFTSEDMRLYLLNNYNPEKITKEILDPNSKFWLAYYNNEAAGYMKLANSPVPDTLIEKFTSSIELQKLYLLKEYHNMGVGKELMKTCIKYAKEKGYDSVWLCVLQENLKAVKFYEDWGFRVFGSKNITVGLANKEHSLMVKQI
jgi:diamine N-acetyltransferase